MLTMKRRTFSIKRLTKRGASKAAEDHEFADIEAASLEACAKEPGRRNNGAKLKSSPGDKKHRRRLGAKPSKTSEEFVKPLACSPKQGQDAPPPYSELDDGDVVKTDEDAPNEVLISWDDAVKRCIPFNDLEGLQYLRADSGSTLEDDLLYGTSELLNQYEVGWDDFETGEDDPTMDGTASLPARYPSSYSGRKYAAKVASVQDLRLGSKMYGTSHNVPQFYDLHSRGMPGCPPPSRTLVGEAQPQGNLRRSLPTSYASRPPENLLLDMDGPRGRHHPRAQPSYEPMHRAPSATQQSMLSGRRSPPPREERVANGLRRSIGGILPRSRSKYTPAIAVRRDPVLATKSPIPKLDMPGGRMNGQDPGHGLTSPDLGTVPPVGILKREPGEYQEEKGAATGKKSVSMSSDLSPVNGKPTSPETSNKKEKAVVFGAYQPKKPDMSSLARREAKKVAMKNINISRAMEAATAGNIVALQHLLQLKVPGMEVTAVSRDEDQKVTVIHRAAEAGQLDCLRFLMGTLLSCDASPQDATTLVDIADRTPAMLALQNGHQECLEYLLQCGNGDLEIDDHGRTLLHHAAYHGQTTCLQYLIDVAGKNGKDITDLSDDMDVTPAHVAAQQGYIDCLRLLVENEVDICQPDVDGLTPLDWATKAGQPLCQHYLTMVEKCWDLTDQLEQAQEKLERSTKEVTPLKEQLDEAASRKAGLQKMLEQTKVQCEKKIEQNEKECAKALSSFLHLLSTEQQKILCHQLPTSLLSALSTSQKKLSCEPLQEKARTMPRTMDACDQDSPTRSSEGDSSDGRSTSSQNSLSADSGCGLEAAYLSNGNTESKDTAL